MATKFTKQLAWFFMSEEEKVALRAARFAGRQDMGGGSPYRPLYWHVQEEAGAALFGIPAKHYIHDSIADMAGRINTIIGEFLNA